MRIIFFLLAVFFAYPAFCEADSLKVVALVNDQVISSLDLNDRIYLVMATTGIPDTEENRAKLAPQILRQLINEKLQLQDARANSINIDDAKVQDTIGRIEKQNGKPPGSLEEFLVSKHASVPSFKEQVRAQAAWAETVMKKIRPRIRISDQEVARYTLKRKGEEKNNGALEEVLIATIQLPIDSPKNEPSVHKAADKLAAEIRSGASFEAIAAQFSSSAAGTRAADPFWVELSQLDPAVAAALSKTAKGGVTAPVKTESGYQLVKLFNTRAKAGSESEVATAPARPHAELAFKQIIISPRPEHNPSKKAFAEAAKTVADAPGKCSENTVPASIDLNNFDLKASLIRRKSNDLPEQVRTALDNLKVGAVSETVTTPQDARIYMLCERVELPPEPQDGTVQTASNESLRQAIYEEKLDLEAQKYMRNLRREAFVEIRGF